MRYHVGTERERTRGSKGEGDTAGERGRREEEKGSKRMRMRRDTKWRESWEEAGVLEEGLRDRYCYELCSQQGIFLGLLAYSSSPLCEEDTQVPPHARTQSEHICTNPPTHFLFVLGACVTCVPDLRPGPDPEGVEPGGAGPQGSIPPDQELWPPPLDATPAQEEVGGACFNVVCLFVNHRYHHASCRGKLPGMVLSCTKCFVGNP